MHEFTVCWCLLLADGTVKCNLVAANTGNMRLDNFTLGGDAVNCTSQRTLSPGGAVTCLLVHNVSDLIPLAAPDKTDVTLTFPSSAVPGGSVPLTKPVEFYKLKLAVLIDKSAQCQSCKACMRDAGDFVRQRANNSAETASTLSADFKAACAYTAGLKAGRCSQVQGSISTDMPYGNLGRRAASLCFSLALCDRRLGPSCTLPVPVKGTNVSVSTATLDTCTGGLLCSLLALLRSDS